MALVLSDVSFFGPAMPGPFVLHRLEPLLVKKKLLDRETKATKKELQERWEPYYRKLRAMGEQGGEQRVLHHVIEPLVERLGYETIVTSEKVVTREGPESGGYLLRGPEGTPHLRVWVVAAQTDLDAPNKRGRAYRFSPALVAQRVLLKQGEKIGLLTDGLELRIVLSDPSGRDSHLRVELGRSGGWRSSRQAPDSYRLLRALCSPKGVPELGELLDEARLAQSGVTRKLRDQARRAVERFIQGLLDDPANRKTREAWIDLDETAKQLWHEGLIFVYRLLFILKLETDPDPARSFSFATMSTWKNSFSPGTALAPIVEEVRDNRIDTGGFLSESLRALFRLFADGLSSSDLQVNRLGGMLFGPEETPLLDRLTWSDTAVAGLLDALLWTIPDERGRGKKNGEQVLGRESIHYGTLDVEDLGRIYEALLELEPGITREPMCRLRRAKLEVVVPLDQGTAFKKNTAEEGTEAEEDDDGEGKTAKVIYVKEIPANCFFLRVGLGRKASGSYYTPKEFVQFLVQETLGPQLAERSPKNDPNPKAILELNVLDPAMGSGHFLVEACRYLGQALYEACRLCDEQALEAQRKADTTKRPETRAELLERAKSLWQRVADLPDPNDELVAYLPSRILDSDGSGLSQYKALALCRRLVAVHCLYGVDKNPLSVELARISLWLESYAEGLPLTFLEHRLIVGDSLTGPFFKHLLSLPYTGHPLEQLHSQGIEKRLEMALLEALAHIQDLEASVGKDTADLELKYVAKKKLDEALKPLKILAAAWSGGVKLGSLSDEAGYESLVMQFANGLPLASVISSYPQLALMIELGERAIPFDLVFPEVFFPRTGAGAGFDVVLGNPPWEGIQPDRREFAAGYLPEALTAAPRDVEALHASLLECNHVARVRWEEMSCELDANKRILLRLGRHIPREDATRGSGAVIDYFLCFVDRCTLLASEDAQWGLVLPNGFHTNLSCSLMREELIRSGRLAILLGFTNKRRLFDISQGMRFDVLVAGKRSGGGRLRFGLEDPAMLLEGVHTFPMSKLGLVNSASSAFMIPEISTEIDLTLWQIAQNAAAAQTFGKWADTHESSIGEELHASKSAHFFHDATLIESSLRSRGNDTMWPLHEKGTIGAFTDALREIPRYYVLVDELLAAGRQLDAARYYRLAHRSAIHAQEEMKVVFALLPPGVQVAHSAVVEKRPARYPTSVALQILGILNSLTTNALARPRVGLNLSSYIRAGLPMPSLAEPEQVFLAHSALRLVCNHSAYAPLWTEQLAGLWRESTPKHTWPVLVDDDARWLVRASIDAVIADAYGLDRSQYEQVLRSFSHSSYPSAPTLCLAAFDELKSLGLEAFVKKHDPYWGVPLVTDLPKPVLDLPAVPGPATDTFALAAPDAKPPRKKRSKRA